MQVYLYLVLSADVCTNLLVMQVFIPGIISRCLHTHTHTHKSCRHLYLVLSADVCTNLLVMQVFIPGVNSRCLRKPASHAGIYTWCYQQMFAHTHTHTHKSCRHLYPVLSADVCANLLVMQAFLYTWCYQQMSVQPC